VSADAAGRPSDPDAEHLKLLAIFHFVVAPMQALVSSIPIIHFLVGAAIFTGGVFGKSAERAPMAVFGGLFMLVAAAVILFGWALAICEVVAGRSLMQRKRYRFCLVVAAAEAALCMPFGTVLGVFTIVVLVRPSVKAAFGVK
jgi:hypothetical protein